jgi:hypothetical protein
MKRTDKFSEQIKISGIYAKPIRYSSAKKPEKCPKCDSLRIANILYGMPAYSEKLMTDVENGKIILGGCILTGDDPKWQCFDCNTEIYHK